MGKKLGVLSATALTGNNILSSTLYVTALAIAFAGVYAPVVLLFVIVVMLLFRGIYREIAEALPLNGGVYNSLLNATSKQAAAIMGILSLLAFVATAVISAKVGVEYLASLVVVPVVPVAAFLIVAVALLVWVGIQDSAKVAVAIFAVHIVTLAIFICLGLWHGFQQSYFLENVKATPELLSASGGLWVSLYLAFSIALLAMAGFESSVNFIEEQAKGVFAKLLRNIIVLVAIISPLVSFISLSVLTLQDIVAAKDFLLADVAGAVGGSWLRTLVVADAFLVLIGATLTSLIALHGLAQRMALDETLPRIYVRTNSRRISASILVTAVGTCMLVLVVTGGNLEVLANVYAVSFLAVMAGFAIGNLVLKHKRPELPRAHHVRIIAVLIGLGVVIAGIFGNVRMHGGDILYYELYFIPPIILILLVLYQQDVLRYLIRWTSFWPWVNRLLQRFYADLVKGSFLVFVHKVETLHTIMEYVRKNERSRNMILVYCREGRAADARAKKMAELLGAMQEAGFYKDFSFTFTIRKDKFGPALVRAIAEEMDIPLNRVFMGSLRHEHHFGYADVRGVRIIF